MEMLDAPLKHAGKARHHYLCTLTHAGVALRKLLQCYDPSECARVDPSQCISV